MHKCPHDRGCCFYLREEVSVILCGNTLGPHKSILTILIREGVSILKQVSIYSGNALGLHKCVLIKESVFIVDILEPRINVPIRELFLFSMWTFRLPSVSIIILV